MFFYYIFWLFLKCSLSFSILLSSLLRIFITLSLNSLSGRLFISISLEFFCGVFFPSFTWDVFLHSPILFDFLYLFLWIVWNSCLSPYRKNNLCRLCDAWFSQASGRVGRCGAWVVTWPKRVSFLCALMIWVGLPDVACLSLCLLQEPSPGEAGLSACVVLSY